jgi:hypothetical protein
MKKEIIEIEVKTGDSVKDINEVKESIDDLGKKSKKVSKETSDGTKKSTKGFKGMSKGLKGVKKGFSAVGLAMKAAGIGLVIGLFVALKDVIGKNQKVIDGFSSVMTTVGLVFNSVTAAVSDAWKSVSELTGGFDAAKKVILGLINIAIAPLKISFYAIKAGVIGLQLAWEESFLGKGRPEKIAELQDSLREVKQDLIDVAQGVIDSGKSIGKNFSEAIAEVGSLAGAVIDNTKKISISVLKEQADAIVALKNQALMAAAINRGLIEDYDRQAELQRQIRDDVNKSISERQKANEELNTILKEQEKAMMRNAALSVQAARHQLKINDNVENNVALQEALNEVKAIEAQLEGKRSEQLVNQTALVNELNALEQTVEEGRITREIAKRTAEAEAILNEEKRLNKKRENLEIDKQIELDRLQAIIDSTNAGTQMRVDAEQARLNKIQEFAILEDELNEEIRLRRESAAMERAVIDAENQLLSFDTRREALAVQRALIIDDESLSEEGRLLKLQEITDKLMDLDAQKVASQQRALSDIISIAGAETGVGRALLIAKSLLQAKEMILDITKTIAFSQQAVARSLVAVAEGSAQTAKIGFPQNIPMLIGFAAQAVSIIRTIKSAAKGAGGGASATPPTMPSVATPSFNTPANPLAVALGQQESQPIQAYVVSNDVTTSQSLERSIIEASSLG